MKLQSWNRFRTRHFAVLPSLMGSTTTFVHNGATATIKLPLVERVGDSHDELAVASCNCWNQAGEPVYYRIHAVDVTTTCPTEAALPDAVLNQAPNAYKLLDEDTQKKLDGIVDAVVPTALSAFEYWASLLRWVTGFHLICREYRAGSASGWSSYLQETDSQKSVWIGRTTIFYEVVHRLSPEEWLRIQSHAEAGERPPMHIVLFHDARHCIEVGDFRRALVDLSVACEVYLRTTAVEALPTGVPLEAIRIIEDANINQFVSHLFPALLTDAAREQYKRSIKDELSSLFSRRNKLMHVAALEGADANACERFRKVVDALFRLELRSKK
jgi:hypothetical protein